MKPMMLKVKLRASVDPASASHILNLAPKVSPEVRLMSDQQSLSPELISRCFNFFRSLRGVNCV